MDASIEAIEASSQDSTASWSERIGVGTWNIQTFQDKSDFLERFMDENKVDILGVTETRHTSCDTVNGMFKDYTFYGNSYSSRAGGVGFLVRNMLLEG